MNKREHATAAVAESELMEVVQVDELLRCSARHVFRMADAGNMPGPVRLGALIRWRRAELLAWIAAGCKPQR